MSKWVKFSRRFQFTPPKKSAVTLEYSAGDVVQVTAEVAAKAIEKGAAVEVEAPANAAEASAIKSGEQEPKVIPPPSGEPAKGPDAAKPPADAKAGKAT